MLEWIQQSQEKNGIKMWLEVEKSFKTKHVRYTLDSAFQEWPKTRSSRNWLETRLSGPTQSSYIRLGGGAQQPVLTVSPEDSWAVRPVSTSGPGAPGDPGVPAGTWEGASKLKVSLVIL